MDPARGGTGLRSEAQLLRSFIVWKRKMTRACEASRSLAAASPGAPGFLLVAPFFGGGWKVFSPPRPQHPLSTALAVLHQSRFLMNSGGSNAAVVARRRVRCHPWRSFGLRSARLLLHLVRPTWALKPPPPLQWEGGIGAQIWALRLPRGAHPAARPPSALQEGGLKLRTTEIYRIYRENTRGCFIKQ